MKKKKPSGQMQVLNTKRKQQQKTKQQNRKKKYRKRTNIGPLKSEISIVGHNTFRVKIMLTLSDVQFYLFHNHHLITRRLKNQKKETEN